MDRPNQRDKPNQQDKPNWGSYSALWNRAVIASGLFRKSKHLLSQFFNQTIPKNQTNEINQKNQTNRYEDSSF